MIDRGEREIERFARGFEDDGEGSQQAKPFDKEGEFSFVFLSIFVNCQSLLDLLSVFVLMKPTRYVTSPFNERLRHNSIQGIVAFFSSVLHRFSD